MTYFDVICSVACEISSDFGCTRMSKMRSMPPLQRDLFAMNNISMGFIHISVLVIYVL